MPQKVSEDSVHQIKLSPWARTRKAASTRKRQTKSTSSSKYRHSGDNNAEYVTALRRDAKGYRRVNEISLGVSLRSPPAHFLDLPNMLGGPRSPSGTQPGRDLGKSGRPAAEVGGGG